MSDATKRLDLQFGSFACSVQGFDDPVQPVQQVLQALQNLLEETPELADAGISFDAEAIERRSSPMPASRSTPRRSNA